PPPPPRPSPQGGGCGSVHLARWCHKQGAAPSPLRGGLERGCTRARRPGLAMPDPFAPFAQPIPVTVTRTPVTGTTTDGIAVLRLQPPAHDHAPGTECIACATQTDIRALLFDLLQSARQGQRPPFT